MILEDASAFIGFYRKFYFENEIDSCIKKDSGIPVNLSLTNKKAEDYICEEVLNKGQFNKFALAWKSGKLKWKNQTLTTEGFEFSGGYRNGRNQFIDKKGFEVYCNELDSDFPSGEDKFENIYENIYKKSPNNFGPVYIITSVFFKSRGAYPIYDQFAHKALRALESDVSPSEVYIGSNPNKDEVKHIMIMYNEYRRLLSKVFPSETNKNKGLFISRELDQALWVYGHCSVKWPDVIYSKADNLMDEFDEAFKELAK